MVALLVVALAVGAVVVAVGQSAADQNDLRTMTFGRWVAANALAEIRLQDEWPAVGTRSGDAQMGPFRYRWRASISGTEEPEVRRIDVEVTALDQNHRQTLTGFVGR